MNIFFNPNEVFKGFFHLFGELLLAEINLLRTEPPDRSECVLSMGKIAGQHLCPEHEGFQIEGDSDVGDTLSLTMLC